MDLLQYAFMQRALLAALLVGVAAPSVGVYLVQRRLSLVGDGMGHIALTGVAVGILTGTAPVFTALIAAVLGAVVIEVVRLRGRTSGDVALAILFYGGIAGGVVLVGLSPNGSAATLNTYLFGSITTTTPLDVVVFALLTVAVLTVTLGLAPQLFTASNDEEFALAAGLPVARLNILLAIVVATTTVLSMRVVGLLLFSALMIVPTATAQLLARSFRGTLALAMAIGVVVSVTGVVVSFVANTPSGGTIVLLAIAVFAITVTGTAVMRRTSRRRHSPTEDHPHEHGPGCGHEAVSHEGHVDYVHGEHRHAAHGAHYDEH
ncbi:MAG: metal ABC transporter permease [Actinomycetes bacterium]